MSLLLNGTHGHEGGANNYGCCAAGSVTPSFGPAGPTKIFVCASAAPSSSAIGIEDCDIMFILNPRARDANWNKVPIQFRLQRSDPANKFHLVINCTSAGLGASYYELTSLVDPLSYSTELNWDVATFVAMFLDYGVGPEAPASAKVWVGSTAFVVLRTDIAGPADFLAAQSPWCVGGIDGTANISESADLSIDPRFFRGQLMNVATTYTPPADPQDLVNILAGGVSPAHPSVRSYFPVNSTANCWPFSTRISPAGKNVLNGTDGNLTLRDGASISSDLSGVPVMAVLSPTIVQDGWADFTAANQDKNSGADVGVTVRTNAGGTNAGRAFFDFGNLISLGIPAGSTINSATLTLECNVVTVASAQALEVRAVTRAIVEGTGTAQDLTDGLCWDRYDATNVWTVEGGDFTGTADDNTTDPNLTSPLVTGSYPYLVTNSVAACMASLAGACVLCLKRKVDQAPATASNVRYISSEGATPPTLSITYTPPAAASGGTLSGARGVGRIILPILAQKKRR